MEWLSAHWFDLIQSAGIVTAIGFNVAELRGEKTARKIDNLTALIRSHREIWKEYATNPALGRIKQRDVDLEQEPVTREEATFVRFVIAHLYGAYEATRLGEIAGLEKAGEDAAEFISLPIPRAVWIEVQAVQDEKFVQFVDFANSSQKTGLQSDRYRYTTHYQGTSSVSKKS